MVEQLGPYELLEELGRGAMARVWRARDTKLGREVAVKEPLFDSNLPEPVLEEMGRRFVKEARTAARLNHPGVVTVYAADVYEGRPAIAMELVEGATLGDILARTGKLDPVSTLDALDQLLDAVGYAHSQGVVHRDIKPDNVFVGNDGRVKLGDFGIAHVEDSATRGTREGVQLGTPGYMSPEQVRGIAVDGRSDLFSIGVVAYEMLTGHNPFGSAENGDAITLLYRIVNEPAPELPEVVSAGLDADLRPAIMKALSKDPADRPQTAAEFKAMLHGGSAGGAVGATAGTVPLRQTQPLPQAPRSKQRGGLPKWIPYVAVAVVLVAVVGGLFLSANSGGGAVTASPQQSANKATTACYLSVLDGHVALFIQSTGELIKETDIDIADLDPSEAAKLGARVPFESIEAAEKQVEDYREAIERAKKPKGAVPPAFTRFNASSVSNADTIDVYGPEMAMDGNTQTAWNTNGAQVGTGEGEWIELSATDLQHVSTISVMAGYCKSPETYAKNRRPRDITVTFSDGDPLKVELSDKYGEFQTFSLPNPVDTTFVRITINSTYAPTYNGRTYDDCTISEIRIS